MSNSIGKTALLAFALTSAFALAACDVQQTQEGELPDVDVAAEGGEMPAYNVESPEVDLDSAVEMPDEANTEVMDPDELDSQVDDETGDMAEDGAG